jgi:hypothetical protein
VSTTQLVAARHRLAAAGRTPSPTGEVPSDVWMRAHGDFDAALADACTSPLLKHCASSCSTRPSCIATGPRRSCPRNGATSAASTRRSSTPRSRTMPTVSSTGSPGTSRRRPGGSWITSPRRAPSPPRSWGTDASRRSSAEAGPVIRGGSRPPGAVVETRQAITTGGAGCRDVTLASRRADERGTADCHPRQQARHASHCERPSQARLPSGRPDDEAFPRRRRC